MATTTGRLAGKVAIVTGGNSGMGAATVERYVAEGARVTIAARSEGPGRELARRLGDSAMFVRTDVTVEADVKAMVEATVRRWGRLDDGSPRFARTASGAVRETCGVPGRVE